VKRILLICLIAFILSVFSIASADNLEKEMIDARFTQYLQHMLSGEYDLATAFWNNDYLYEVYKFGIAYNNAPYKFDCRSPLIEHLDSIREGRNKVEFKILPKAENIYSVYLEIDNVSLVSTGSVLYQYWMIRNTDMQFYMAPRYWAPIHVMQNYEGKYYHLYYAKQSQINDSALASLDSEIEGIAVQLGIDSIALQRLAADKLNYFLCENFNQVKEYADVTSEPGIHDPAGDFLITSYFPHQKIVSDFLITYKLRDLPLFTQPFIKNGLAVYLGGRAGMSLNSFAQMAHFSFESDFVDFNDLFTVEGFNEKIGGADFSYTLSGYFIGYLIELTDMPTVLDLYLALSGSKSEVNSMSEKFVKNEIEKATGLSWKKIEDGFGSYLADAVDDYIAPVDEISSDNAVYQSGTPDMSITVYSDDNWYYFDASCFDKSNTAQASLLFTPKISSFKEYKSGLFAKHYPDREYAGQFYGVIFDAAEMGSYNYLTAEITSKYIKSLSGDDSEDGAWRSRFKIRKELFPADLNQMNIEIVEAED